MDTCAGVFFHFTSAGSRRTKSSMSNIWHRLQQSRRDCQQDHSLVGQPHTAAILLLPRVHCCIYIQPVGWFANIFTRFYLLQSLLEFRLRLVVVSGTASKVINVSIHFKAEYLIFTIREKCQLKSFA